jgi:hypothetical protein
MFRWYWPGRTGDEKWVVGIEEALIHNVVDHHVDVGVARWPLNVVAKVIGVSVDDAVHRTRAQTIQVLRPLTDDDLAALFHGRPQAWQRLEWIIRATCECYERDGGWLQAARREGDLIPALEQVVGVQQESLRLLVRAALLDRDLSDRSVQVLAALIDFPLWKTFREMGLSAKEATNQVLELVHDHLEKENLI